MLEIFKAIIFGVVQGAAEFLPISSSGHLVILHEIIKLPVQNNLAFDVYLHFATLLAVMYFFRQDIILLIYKFFTAPREKEGRLAWFILFSTVPAALAGWIFSDYIESAFRSPYLVALMLAIVGALLILAERISKKIYTLDNLNWVKCLNIGLAQILSLIPGTSRSGITIIAGLFEGLKRDEAVRFSFLLSIPIIAGAFLKEIPELLDSGSLLNEWLLYLTGFLSALFSGFLAIKYFLKFSSKYKLDIFAYYRFILAIIIVLYFLTS